MDSLRPSPEDAEFTPARDSDRKKRRELVGEIDKNLNNNRLDKCNLIVHAQIKLLSRRIFSKA